MYDLMKRVSLITRKLVKIDKDEIISCLFCRFYRNVQFDTLYTPEITYLLALIKMLSFLKK